MPESHSERYCYLTDLSEKDKPWDEHRRSASAVQKLYQGSEFDQYAKRIDDCSERLVFALTAEDDETFRFRLRSAHFCRCRHCPVCQWRRSLMWRARFFQALPKIQADYPKARYLFLTLTVRNCHITELRATIQQMNRGWKKLSERKKFPAIGFIKAVEVTRNNQDNSAHPHLHILMMVKPSYFNNDYISQQKWIELWRDSVGVSYDPSIRIQAVKPPKGESEGDSSSGVRIALLETLKYHVKVSDLVANADWLAELTRQLHKTRAVAVGGVFRKYLRENEPEDLVTEDAELEPAPEDAPLIYFDWMEQVRRYAKVDPRDAP